MMQNRVRRMSASPVNLASIRTLGKPGCAVCAGTGWEVVPLRQTSLARRCRCRTERNREFWTETVGVPSRLWWLELRDLLREGLIPARTRQQLHQYLRKFPDVPGTLFVVGDCGTTAARLQTAVLKEVWRLRQCRVSYTACGLAEPSEVRANLFEDSRIRDREALAESAELAVFDGWLGSGISVEQQLRWGEVLRRRFLARKHSIINCDNWSSKAVIAACEGQSNPFHEETSHLLRSLGSDSAWWWLAHRKGQQGVFSSGGQHDAVA
jgi:hypothetical protein